jgi:hypothetical protein
VVFFFSDHGIRFGKIRDTLIGKFEERLPFMHVILPPEMKTTYPEIVENLKSNAKKLTTNFDVYETLLDLMDFQAENPPNRYCFIKTNRYRFNETNRYRLSEIGA